MEGSTNGSQEGYESGGRYRTCKSEHRHTKRRRICMAHVQSISTVGAIEGNATREKATKEKEG
jgi:hypothetical protein